MELAPAFRARTDEGSNPPPAVDPLWTALIRQGDAQADLGALGPALATHRRALRHAERRISASRLSGGQLVAVEMLLVSCRHIARLHAGQAEADLAAAIARRPFDLLLPLVWSEDLPRGLRLSLLRYLRIALHDYLKCLRGFGRDDDLASGIFDCARDSVFVGAVTGSLRSQAPARVFAPAGPDA